ncbi:MAG TPA: 30S ribosomal protein S6 [Candidatus Eisenbacteria bacterium]|jgi:small subunit ribosomal protein S6|nr:30S ribosomal protein S6 [Candidatus Eisenbacteria bacterium]
MKLYETTIIFDPGLEEARINEEVDRVTGPIAQAGGEVVEVQRWGKKKLAYNIKKRRDGTYIHVKHKSPATLIAEMDRRFRLNESVLRHLTVLAPKDSPRPAEEAKTEGAPRAEGAPAPAEPAPTAAE